MTRYSFTIVLFALLSMGCGTLHTDGTTEAVQLAPTFEDPSKHPQGNTVLSTDDDDYYLGVESKIRF
jgi:hypothetical protein